MRLVLVMTLTRASETAVLAGDQQRTTEALGEALQLLSMLGVRRFLGDCLELVALTLAGRGASGAATEMFGAAAAVHEAMGEASAVRLLTEQSQACRLRLAEDLGAVRFGRHHGEGRALPAEQAIAAALVHLQRPRT
jgi:hypothetical protein